MFEIIPLQAFPRPSNKNNAVGGCLPVLESLLHTFSLRCGCWKQTMRILNPSCLSPLSLKVQHALFRFGQT